MQRPAVMPGNPHIASCREIAGSAVQPLCRQSYWGWPEGPEPAGVFVYPPPYGVAAPCGTDWTTPCATLSDGIAQAATSSATQIWVGPGAVPGPDLKHYSHQALHALLKHGHKGQLSSNVCRHTGSQVAHRRGQASFQLCGRACPMTFAEPGPGVYAT